MSERRPSAGEAGIEPEYEEDHPTAREEADLEELRRSQDRRPTSDAPIIPGNVGSVDDVPADAASAAVVEE